MREWYVADFETTNVIFYEQNGYTKVWLYAVSDSNGNIVNYGDSIDKFIEWCYNNPNIDVYFHNLKFDGAFILNYLFEHKFEYKDKLTTKDNRGFTTLIGEEGQFYSIKMNFARKKQISFYDSLKLIPLKVEQIAKAFKLPILKEKIDYGVYIINEETLNYVFNDVKIVAMALKYFKDLGFNKMTIGANAYNLYKQETKYFKDLFPSLDREWLKEWRVAYRGGRTQVNPKYQNTIVHNVKRFDINSMYPYAMSRFPMPYGEPIKLYRPNQYKFELYKVNIGFKLKEGHMPTLLKSGGMYNKNGDTYYIETDVVEIIYISNIDLELVKKHYDIYFLEFLEIYGFRTSSYIFRNWIDKYYELKSNSTGGLRLVWKLVINNIYGKFGSRCVGKKKIPKYDNKLEFTLTEEEDMTIYYLPVAIAITSWCHKLIDDAICETGIDCFIYCDTDSVHTIGDLPSEWIDNYEIGKFKFEGTEEKAKYIRQKCYVYRESTEKGYHYNITCSGMTEKLKDFLIEQHNDNVFEVFDIGLTLDENTPNITLDDMKLRPCQVKGGVVLSPTPFSLL